MSVKREIKKKKWKVIIRPEVMKDIDDIPEEDYGEFEKEFSKIIKGFESGEIDPREIGEPLDIEKLKKEEPDLYYKLTKMQ